MKKICFVKLTICRPISHFSFRLSPHFSLSPPPLLRWSLELAEATRARSPRLLLPLLLLRRQLQQTQRLPMPPLLLPQHLLLLPLLLPRRPSARSSRTLPSRSDTAET